MNDKKSFTIQEIKKIPAKEFKYFHSKTLKDGRLHKSCYITAINDTEIAVTFYGNVYVDGEMIGEISTEFLQAN